MRRFDSSAAQPDDEKLLDDALERLVRGDASGLDRLDPELRATVQQLFAWADEGGLPRRTAPAKHARPKHSVLTRFGPVVSGIAAVLVVGLIVLTGYLASNLSPDDEGTPTRVIPAFGVGTLPSWEAALPEPTPARTATPIHFATAAPTFVPTATPTPAATATPTDFAAVRQGLPEPIVTVIARDIYFEPSYVSIPRGGTLALISQGELPHTFVIEGYNDERPIILGPGEPQVYWPIPDDLALGTYTFFCSVTGHRNAGMVGTMTITD